MKILFVSNRLPYAGVAGGYSIIYERVAGLAKRGHHVGLVAFMRDETPEQVDDLRGQLAELELVTAPKPRSFLRRVYDYMCSPIPSRFRSFRSQEMKRRIGEMVERTHYDIVVTEFTRMGQHIHQNPYLSAVRRVVSCHRSLSLLHQKEVEILGWGPLSVYQRLRLKGMEAFEYALYRNADNVLVLTPQEQYWMLSRLPGTHITVVPSGVDIDYYSLEPGRPKEHAVIFTGNYRDSSNEDAVLWFVKHVWPGLSRRNPALIFYVVGPSPSPAMLRLQKRDKRIVVTGRVNDLRTFLYKSKVLVCPVRLGAGIRTKVLEAMAAGLPVVSTVLGVEGIPAQVGDNCFLADQAELMEEYVDLLLNDEDLASSLAARARQMIVERFSWDSSLTRLEQTLQRLVNNK